jgi:hypothetical protein
MTRLFPRGNQISSDVVDPEARFDALALLARAPGALVTKDRFMDEVWRGVPVTDEALTQCIRTLRRTLGEQVQLRIEADAAWPALADDNQLTIRLAYNLFTQKPKGEKDDFLNWTKTSTYKQGDDYFRHNGAGEMLVFSAAVLIAFPRLSASSCCPSASNRS